MIVTVTLNTCIDKTVQVRGFAVGATLKGKVLRRRPAGKGINVSRCLAALGHRSVAAGFVGRNERLLFSREIALRGIAELLIEVDGRTRDNITYIDPDAHTETHIREEGFEVTQAGLDQLHSALASIADRGDTVVFSGSMPPGLPDAALADLVAASRRQGASVVVDSNGEPFRLALEARPLLIKPNIAELEELTGTGCSSPEQIAASARSLLDRVQTIAVSMGARGAVCVTAGEAWYACGEVAGVQHTVGCGDALLAGFIAAREEAAPLRECLREAVACGGASARCDIASDLRRQDVDSLLPLVEVKRIA